MTSSILSAKGIEKFYSQDDQKQLVLRGVTADFEQGKSYALTGVSGSGKSTFLHILGGLDTPTAGDLFFDEENIKSFSQKRKESFLNKEIGFVFQFHYLINEFSVLENLMVPGLIFGENRNFCKQRAKELLSFMQLENVEKKYPFELSGGELQRVSALRALFNKPKFILADEPTGNLDARNAAKMVDLFLKCQHEWGLGIIICSHDPDVYDRMDTIFKLHEGVLSVAKK
ncbi:TPA: lipoprotein-releasing system ATP-binding protein LolD [Candidatus Dependentiae bacterium]|nr:MAG: ABC-type transport system, involved in lipoprotein release, ATPase component [candidate division TM6 bacterium GW2011_GWE2_31_21]KKP53488.1 MAG: ABC-type transport system, involved in lipoprotein release, ATPase component [candidate division TM6 bacterium GW2011_GWF2_33_332]HBS48270.1 lipoprotein-releasing system ATP-binding protein LolD [Candidatus Dependentiae bacterium]HBZ73697.1 lipoprotein-releasing system ATP-binding protein LolD [Candidatus Dependentiae bacterium]